MAHAQKPVLVFQRNGTSPFKSADGGVSSVDYCAAEVCASAVVMLDTPCSEVECKTSGYPLHSHVSPSLPLPCAITFQLDSITFIMNSIYNPRQICQSYNSICFYFNFNTSTVHLLLSCTVTNKCTVISQIITLLHVSTLSCHPQGAFNQYLAKLHRYFKSSFS
jgi:hypothetical protein